MATRFHAHLEVRQTLRALDGMPLGAPTIFASSSTGEQLNSAELQTFLTIELLRGHECIPLSDRCDRPCKMNGCAGFDFERTGCPGYPVSDEA